MVELDESAKRHVGRGTRYDKDLYRSEIVEYTWQMQENGELQCLDCPDYIDDEDEDAGRIRIDEEGLDIKIQENGDSFKMKAAEKD